MAATNDRLSSDGERTRLLSELAPHCAAPLIPCNGVALHISDLILPERVADTRVRYLSLIKLLVDMLSKKRAVYAGEKMEVSTLFGRTSTIISSSKNGGGQGRTTSSSLRGHSKG